MIFNKIKEYRFSFWIAVFSFLLIAIPISVIYLKSMSLAKFFGILLVILLILALKIWFSVAKNRNDIVPRVVLNKNDLFDLNKDFKDFLTLSASNRDILVNRIGLLLSKVKFVDASNTLLDRRNAVRVAYTYVCLNTGQDFKVNTDWVFLFSPSKPESDTLYKYVLLEDDFKTFKTNFNSL